MSKAIILQHVPFEGPGRLVPVFRDFGVPIEVRHLYRGDEVPQALDDVRILISMGGPMGVSDIGSAEYPFLAQEAELLKKVVARDHPFLGICLGAQMMAHAGGAKVYPNVKPAPAGTDAAPTPLPEIGWGPVSFPFPGGTEPVVFGMHDGAMMFHWHFDTFDLPKLPTPPNPPPPPAPAPPTGNALLSSTRTCRNQAFRFKTRLFGFQYHFEMDRDGIEAMLDNGRADVEKVLGAQGAEQIRRDTLAYYADHERLGNRIVRNLVEFLRLS
jgi:GMP synthase-like glutamine amidotransferase